MHLARPDFAKSTDRDPLSTHSVSVSRVHHRPTQAFGSPVDVLHPFHSFIGLPNASIHKLLARLGVFDMNTTLFFLWRSALDQLVWGSLICIFF